jgi:hypothetical protein
MHAWLLAQAVDTGSHCWPLSRTQNPLAHCSAADLSGCAYTDECLNTGAPDSMAPAAPSRQLKPPPRPESPAGWPAKVRVPAMAHRELQQGRRGATPTHQHPVRRSNGSVRACVCRLTPEEAFAMPLMKIESWGGALSNIHRACGTVNLYSQTDAN